MACNSINLVENLTCSSGPAVFSKCSVLHTVEIRKEEPATVNLGERPVHMYSYIHCCSHFNLGNQWPVLTIKPTISLLNNVTYI